MTNRLYLLIDEKRQYALVKVGFTKDFEKRKGGYLTANPEAHLIDLVATQERTGRTIEKLFHQELEKRGYLRANGNIEKIKRSEWFRIPYTDPFLQEIQAKGFQAFTNGKNRKSLIQRS
jgi:hypothetical protein